MKDTSVNKTDHPVTISVLSVTVNFVYKSCHMHFFCTSFFFFKFYYLLQCLFILCLVLQACIPERANIIIIIKMAFVIIDVLVCFVLQYM